MIAGRRQFGELLKGVAFAASVLAHSGEITAETAAKCAAHDLLRIFEAGNAVGIKK